MKPLAGRPILAHVLDRLDGQAERVLLNANGDPTRFAAWNLPVAADVVAGFGGPLVGVLTALDWAAAHAPGITDVVSVPGDGPFLATRPGIPAGRGAAETGAELAQAASNGRPNPVVGLWPVALAAELRQAVVEEGIAKVHAWTARYRLATVDFPATPFDPFFNANTTDGVGRGRGLDRAGDARPGAGPWLICNRIDDNLIAWLIPVPASAHILSRSYRSGDGRRLGGRQLPREGTSYVQACR